MPSIIILAMCPSPSIMPQTGTPKVGNDFGSASVEPARKSVRPALAAVVFPAPSTWYINELRIKGTGRLPITLSKGTDAIAHISQELVHHKHAYMHTHGFRLALAKSIVNLYACELTILDRHLQAPRPGAARL